MAASRERVVLVVAYGAEDLLAQALEPLAEEHVVVVDNSASPAIADITRGHGHTYLDPGANLGFAAGVNVGLRHLAERGERTGPGPDVLLLNPDARIEPADLDRLQDRMLSEPDVAAAAPEIRGPDGAPHLTWYPLPSSSQMWRLATRAPWLPRPRDFLMGACLLLRAEALAEVGPLDERFFLYAEEADWQHRAFAAGWRVVLVPEALALHHHGATNADDTVRTARVTAGQELHVRLWEGAAAAASFRLAGWIAMMARARSWPGAREVARCFRRGPRRVAPLPPRRLRVLHVAVGSGAQRLDRDLLARADGAAEVALDARRARRLLADPLGWDVVHVHDRSSLRWARVMAPLHGTRVVADEGVGRRRVGGGLRRRVDLVAPVSSEVDYRALEAAGSRKTNTA